MQKQNGMNLNKLILQKELFQRVSTDRDSEKSSARWNVFWRSPKPAENVQRQQGEGERYKEKCRKTAAQAKIFKLLSVKSDASAPRVRLNSQKYAQLQK